MAARLIQRLSASPPIDVEAICQSLATLKFKPFPTDFDGVCLDLKVPGKKPKVWVSKSIHPLRQRFTIAHEIGHIVIPWHTGTIYDNIDAPRSGVQSTYRQLEVEANRFAAELLMPSRWAIGLAERSDHAAGLMHTIWQRAEVSLPAAFIKTARYGKPGFVAAEVKDGLILRSLRTPGTYSIPPQVGSPVDQTVMPAAHEPEIISGSETSYYWWEIREVVDDPGSILTDWRTILEKILDEIPSEARRQARASVNAIIGSAFGRVKRGSPVSETYKIGLEAIQNRNPEDFWLKHVLEHETIKDYVLARARERAKG